MTKKMCKLVILVVVTTTISSMAWTPTFGNGDTLKLKSGKIIGMNDTLMFGSPEFADWDDDGKVDLMLGYWGSWSLGPGLGGGYDGRIRFFKNNGTNLDPNYSDEGDLYAGGSVIDLEVA